MSKLQSYLSSWSSACIERRAQTMADLLSISPAPPDVPFHPLDCLVDEFSNLTDQTFAQSFPSSNLDVVWRECVQGHLKACSAWIRNDPVLMIREQNSLVQMFLRWFGSHGDTRWILPFLYKLVDDLWFWSKQIDNEKIKEETARTINRAFTFCVTDRSSQDLEKSRKWGTLRIANLLFKIYFHLRQLNLCMNLIRAVDAAELPERALYYASQRATYAFYHGRYQILMDKPDISETSLMEAWSLTFCYARFVAPTCPFPRLSQNEALILHFAIPSKLHATGKRPSFALLTSHFPPSLYARGIQLLAIGNIDGYLGWIKQNELLFLRLGTYVLWYRLYAFIGIPRLVKHVHMIFTNDLITPGGNPTRMPLGILLNCSRRLDRQEMLCLLVNSIGRKNVRAYISEEKQMLVLSALNPFPRLTGFFNNG